jgi:hypothetical protein
LIDGAGRKRPAPLLFWSRPAFDPTPSRIDLGGKYPICAIAGVLQQLLNNRAGKPVLFASLTFAVQSDFVELFDRSLI